MVKYAVVKRFIRRFRRHIEITKEGALAIIELKALLAVILDIFSDPPW